MSALQAAKRALPERRREMLRSAVFWLPAQRPGALDALARYYGTDKYQHRFTAIYRRHFATRRRTVRSVLEIGVGGITSVHGHETAAGGQSLRMWRDYFPNAQILGIDIHRKEVSGPRIHFEQGDQSDQSFLRSLSAKHGPFDIIVDDGSHVGRHVLASFAGLWDAVTPGGLYVVEDLAAAYEPIYGGGPPGTPDTAAALIIAQVDKTIRRPEQPVGEPSPDRPLAAMHLYADLVIFEKSR